MGEQGSGLVRHAPQADHQAPRSHGEQRLGKADVTLAAFVTAQTALAGAQHHQVGIQLPALARICPAVSLPV